MIYIFTLVAISIFAVVFDFGQVKSPQLKNACYISLLIWLSCLSGFAYNVGSDIPGYMSEYADIGHHKFNSWSDLSYLENRQLGWVILNIVCSRIYNRFVLLHLVVAIFTKYIILEFIKKHTQYVFVGIFLYFICSYFNFNFNGLRQTVAISFFLYGYDYLVEKKWIKYYLCVFCAFMFHSSAVICAVFPFMYLIKANLRNGIIVIVSLLIFSIFTLVWGGSEILSEMVLNNAYIAGYFTDRERIVEAYFGDNAMKYEGLNLFGILQMLLFITPIILTITSGFKRYIIVPSISLLLLLFYLFFYLLDFAIPVVFMRLIMFLDILYYCALSDFVIDYPKKKGSPMIIITTLILCMVLFRPVKTLFSENASSGLLFYKQFYPYYSVFYPQIDPVRATYFGCYREK